MIALRLAVAVAGALGATVAGAWAGGTFSESSGDAGRRVTGTVRETAPIAVADALEVSGQPMRLSVFHTRDEPARVAAFYAEAFRARGLLPLVSAADGFAHAAAFDPRDGLQRFVSALSGPTGETLALVGTVDPRRPAALLSGTQGASLVLPEDHRALLSFRSVDGGVRSESVQFRTRSPVARVEAFYREALTRDGYAQAAGGPEGLLRFSRAGATVSVAASASGDGPDSVVFVTRTEERTE